MDDQTAESRTRALRSERARATPFAGPDVGPGAIAMTSAAIVQGLTGRADIAIVFRFISETLRTEEWTPLSVDAVAGSHIGSDVTIRQPLQELPVSVRGVSGHRFGGSSLPLRETGQHVLCSHRFLTHACRCGLHSDNHTAVVIHQIVVVVTKTGRRAAFGGVSRIGIGGRHLLLL